MKKEIYILIGLIAIFSFALVLPAKAATLGDASTTVATPYINNVSRYSVSFYVASSTEVEAQIRLIFPAGFNVSAAANQTSTISVSSTLAAATVASSTVSGQEITLWLADGAIAVANDTIHFSGIPNIVNHATAGNYTLGIETRTQANDLSETGGVASTTAFTISGVGAKSRTKKSYTVNFSANPSGGGTVPNDDSYIEGVTVIANAVPKSGYDFVAWEENGVEISKNHDVSFTVNANKDLVARFKAVGTGGTAEAPPETTTTETTPTTVEGLKAKIVEVQQKIINLLQELIQLIQQQIQQKI